MKNKDRKCQFRNQGSSESPVLIEDQAYFNKNYSGLYGFKFFLFNSVFVHQFIKLAAADARCFG
jgi:hypothetical protein